jgi:hypothetical protein
MARRGRAACYACVVLAGVLRRIAGWRRAPAWQRRLASRGIEPLPLRALAAGRSLEDGWVRLPRVDWALEIAVAARVEPAVVRRGLLEVLEETAGWRVPRELPATLRAAAEDWAGGRLGDEALRARLAPALRELVERSPDLEAALAELREAERWRSRVRTQAAADAYDQLHAAVHRRLADRFRRVVTTAALAFALGEAPAHPYR